jgi:hypothetical protein
LIGDDKEVSLEAIAKYLEAIQQINVADRELDQMLENVKQTVQALPDRWATLSVPDIAEPLVPDVPSSHERSTLSSAQWPTIDQIARVLSQMHQAYDAAEVAWENVEPRLRDFLFSPPTRFPPGDRLIALARTSSASRETQATIDPSPTTFEG